MNKTKVLKKVMAGVLIGCTAITNAAYAAPKTDISAKQSATQNDVSIMRSKILQRGTLSLIKGTNKVSINITTYSYSTCDHLYHDVTIFVNGVRYLSDRYDKYNIDTLKTSINVPVKDGDYVDVYADHYAQDGSTVESSSSHKSITY